jgi:acyl-CoA oxidase
LQTARYLLKTWQQVLQGSKVTSTVAYLKNYADRAPSTPKENFDTSPRGILRALQSATAGKIGAVYRRLEELKKSMTPEEAANQSGIELVRIGQLHAKVFMLQSAVNEFEKAARNSSTKISYTFRDILELYSIDVARNYLGDLMQVFLKFKIIPCVEKLIFRIFPHFLIMIYLKLKF